MTTITTTRFLMAATAAGLFATATPALARGPQPGQESQADRQACEDDAFQFCGEAIPDRDRVYHCLVRKVKLISPACRKVIIRSRSR